MKAVPKLTARTTPIFGVSANGGGVVGSAVVEAMPENVIGVCDNVTTPGVTVAVVIIADGAVIVALIDGNGVAIACPVIVVLGMTILSSSAGVVRSWPGSRLLVLAIVVLSGSAELVRAWLDSGLAVLAIAVLLSDAELDRASLDSGLAVLAIAVLSSDAEYSVFSHL